MKIRNNIKNAVSIASGLNIPGGKEVTLTDSQIAILEGNKTAKVWIEKGVLSVIDEPQTEAAPAKKSKKD